jgi:hypothetical protein
MFVLKENFGSWVTMHERYVAPGFECNVIKGME